MAHSTTERLDDGFVQDPYPFYQLARSRPVTLSRALDAYLVTRYTDPLDGAFANFTGTVDDVKMDKQKLKVKVSIFGRPTSVELDFAAVQKR